MVHRCFHGVHANLLPLAKWFQDPDDAFVAQDPVEEARQRCGAQRHEGDENGAPAGANGAPPAGRLQE